MSERFNANAAKLADFHEVMHAKLGFVDASLYQFFWKPYLKTKSKLDAAVCCNWWRGAFVYRRITFPTAEHAMMWAKADLFNDPIAAAAILESKNPHDAKAIGRQVRNFDTSVWDDKCYDIVKDIVRAKFTQSNQLRHWLKNQPPGTIFVEASPLDRIWGIKMADDHRNVNNHQKWLGYNLLGYAITEVFMELTQ